MREAAQEFLHVKQNCPFFLLNRLPDAEVTEFGTTPVLIVQTKIYFPLGEVTCVIRNRWEFRTAVLKVIDVSVSVNVPRIRTFTYN